MYHTKDKMNQNLENNFSVYNFLYCNSILYKTILKVAVTMAINYEIYTVKVSLENVRVWSLVSF